MQCYIKAAFNGMIKWKNKDIKDKSPGWVYNVKYIKYIGKCGISIVTFVILALTGVGFDLCPKSYISFLEKFFNQIAEDPLELYSVLMVIIGFTISLISYLLTKFDVSINGVLFKDIFTMVFSDRFLKRLIRNFVIAAVYGLLCALFVLPVSLLLVYVYTGGMCLLIVWGICASGSITKILPGLIKNSKIYNESEKYTRVPLEILIVSTDYKNESNLKVHLIDNVINLINKKISASACTWDKVRDINSYGYRVAADIIEKCNFEYKFPGIIIQNTLYKLIQEILNKTEKSEYGGENQIRFKDEDVVYVITGMLQGVICHYSGTDTGFKLNNLLENIRSYDKKYINGRPVRIDTDTIEWSLIFYVEYLYHFDGFIPYQVLETVSQIVVRFAHKGKISRLKEYERISGYLGYSWACMDGVFYELVLNVLEDLIYDLNELWAGRRIFRSYIFQVARRMS